MSLGPDARALIEAASGGDEPEAADAARVRSKIVERLALGAAAGAATTFGAKAAIASVPPGAAAGAGAGVALTGAAAGSAATAGSVGTTLAAKLILAAAIAGGGATLSHDGGSAPIPPPLPTHRFAMLQAGPQVSGGRDARGPAGAPGPGEVAPAQAMTSPQRIPTPMSETVALPAVASTVAAPNFGSAPTGISRSRATEGHPTPSQPVVARPSATSTSSPSSLPSPIARSSAAEPSLPPPPREERPAPRDPPSDGVSEEAALLRAANAALARGDGASALAVLDQHAARFPYGALREEENAARVFALCASGRAAEARAAGARFIATSPRSPLVERMRRTCAEK